MEKVHASTEDKPETEIQRDALALPPQKRVGTYIAAWAGIIILTGLTFAASRMSVQEGRVIASLFIAGVQAGLALVYFMHLGAEKATIFKVLIPLVLAVLLIFIALTFSDVAFRRS